jgi:hypothetical protein
MLDKTDATKLLTRIRRQWFAKRKSVAAILKEVMTNEASALLDTDAHNKAMDADAALQELARISHRVRRIGAPNQRKLFCENDFLMIRGEPRCRQSVSWICLDLKPSKAAR